MPMCMFRVVFVFVFVFCFGILTEMRLLPAISGQTRTFSLTTLGRRLPRDGVPYPLIPQENHLATFV